MRPILAAPSDPELLRAVASGDSQAFMAIYDRYNRIAFGLAYRVLGESQAAEEVVQDAFLQVWSRAKDFDFSGSANVRGWILTIVHHRAIDAWRRARRPDRQSVTLDDELELRSMADTWEDVARTLTREEILDAVDGLPDDQRRAIEMAYFAGLTQREIADREGAPLGTVKGRLRLGLNKLRTVLAVSDQRNPSGRG